MLERGLHQKIEFAQKEIRNIESHIQLLVGSLDDDQHIDSKLQSEIDYFSEKLKAAILYFNELKKD